MIVDLSQLVGEEVDTEEVEEGAEDFICCPERVPIFFIDWVNIVVENIRPSHENSEI
jgi:hypothetical protein